MTINMKTLTLKDINNMDIVDIKKHLVTLSIKKLKSKLTEKDKLNEIYLFASIIQKGDSINQITKRYNEINNKAINIINRRNSIK